MNLRLTAAERMIRLLAVIPWVLEQQSAPLDEIASRFDYPRAQLIEDLTQVVFFVGVHPFTPDSLIEVDISDDEVQIRHADWFSRPLSLTASEGARLLTAGRSLLSAQADSNSNNSNNTGNSGNNSGNNSGTDPDNNEDASNDQAASPLLRALTKLGMALGEAADQAVEVRLGQADQQTLSTLRDALNNGKQVNMQYYSYGRDQLSSRVVEPLSVFSDNGRWYLHAWCHQANDERIFRVDRIRSVKAAGKAVTHQSKEQGSSFSLKGDEPKVELRLHPDSAWVTAQYPTESVETDNDGWSRVTMVVTELSWLERLLLRLGPHAEIVNIDAPLSPNITAEAAKRVLKRYQ